MADSTSIEEHVLGILDAIDPEPRREGLERTPDRVARALTFLTRGYREDPRAVINGALFTEEYSEMIVVKDIDFYSLCEHHILPFFGRAHVAYLPRRKIVGISKIARLVEVYARRLQVQERLTTQIANTIQEQLDPLGVAVVMEAEHLCMRMRGVEKQNSTVVTSAMLGAFQSHQETRRGVHEPDRPAVSGALAAHALELLGGVPGPVAVIAPGSPRLRGALASRVRAASDEETPSAAIVAWLGIPADPGARQAALAGLRRRLAAGAPLVLVDHNQPRRRTARLLAWVRLRLAGLSPSRGRYPAARELAALGFDVERLRLACGERVQLVRARRR